jgi:hypothetical protein
MTTQRIQELKAEIKRLQEELEQEKGKEKVQQTSHQDKSYEERLSAQEQAWEYERQSKQEFLVRQRSKY